MNTYNTDLETILQIAEKLAEKGILAVKNEEVIYTELPDNNELILYVTEENKHLIHILTDLFNKYGFYARFSTFKRSITIKADLSTLISIELEKCFTEVLEK